MAKKKQTKRKPKVIVRSELPPVQKWQREEALRKAEVAFVTDELQRPLEYWWQLLCDKVIQLRGFQERADRGKWAQRREKFWQAVVQEILRKSKYRAVHDRVKELQEIQQVRDNTLELIQPKIIEGQKFYKVQPSTFEGMINALVKLDALADAKRDAVLAMIEPDLAREELGEERMLFAHDEMSTLSEVLLNLRMEKQQKRLEAHRAEEASDEDGISGD